MNYATAITGLLIAAAFIVMILFILFGQITVRKLRKNPETKEHLGMEFASGWDIINVAFSLTIPERLSNVLKKSALSGLYANAEILKKNTTVFDRLLARVFYVSFFITGLCAIIFAIFYSFNT